MKKTEKKITEQKREEWFNAIRKNDMDAIKKMIGEGIDVNLQDSSGWAALHLASSFGYIDISKHLIDSGADINIRDNIGWTSLHIACYWGKISIAKLLINNGADVILKDINGNTPLDRLKSYQQHHEELIEWLSENHPEKMLEHMSNDKTQSNGIGL